MKRGILLKDLNRFKAGETMSLPAQVYDDLMRLGYFEDPDAVVAETKEEKAVKQTKSKKDVDSTADV